MTRLELHGPVDDASVRAVLAQWPARGPITLEINSPGGDVMAGWSIISKIRNHSSPVTARITGFALSMAANIAAACQRVEAVENAVIMIHDPHMVAHGNASTMRRHADALERTATILVEVLAKKTSKTPEALAPTLAAETWMDASEAMAFGLVDEILPAAARMDASFDLSSFSPPPQIAAKLREVQMTTAIEKTPKPEAAAAVAAAPDNKQLIGDALAHVMSAVTMAISCGIPTERVMATATRMAANGNDPQAINNRLLNMMADHQDANSIDTILPGNGNGTPYAGAGSRTFANPEFRIQAMGEALFTRLDPTHKASDQARPYCGLSVPEIAREVLKANGLRVTGMSSAQVVAQAMTTSDFVGITTDIAGRTLRRAYDAGPSGLKRVARRATAKDFRPVRRYGMGEYPELQKVGENGEIKHGPIGSEGGVVYQLDTFGRIISITRQALVNDDLGALSDVMARYGQSAAALEADYLAGLVNTNPTLWDGVAVFHASRGNLAASGTALDVAALTAGRKAMRQMKSVDGNLIDVTAKFLVVGPELETTAEQVLATLQATKVADVNPFAGNLELVVEPRITSTAFFLAAEPGRVDGLEYAYLSDAQGPMMKTEEGFDVDAIRMRVLLDFAAGWVDFRGWYKNPGL